MTKLTSKKIVFIHLLNDYSGSPKVLSQVIKAVQKKGCEVELYSGKSADGFLTGLTDKYYHYFYKRFDNKYLTLITFMLSQVHLFFKLLKHKNEDVIVYVNTMLPFGAALAGKLMGKPVYYHVHESSLSPASFKGFLRTIVQKTASKVLFVSKDVEGAESFTGINQQVIYNALPLDFMKIAVETPYQHRVDQSFNVLMICSLKAYKGINEFITISKLIQDVPNIKFTLVLNAELLEIDAYFQKNELPSNVTLVSRQKNLIPFYEKTNLLLNLSRVDQWVETFGLTIVEAMAFGIPVIVPTVGGPTEIVRDGVDGYLLSSYETDKIAKIIIELSENDEKCQALSQAARKRSENFNEKLFEEKIFDFSCN